MYISVMTTDQRFVLMDNSRLHGPAKDLLTKDSYIEVYDDDSFLGSMHYTTVDVTSARINGVNISDFDSGNDQTNKAFKLIKNLDTIKRMHDWENRYKIGKHTPAVVAVYVDLIYTEPECEDIIFDLITHIPAYVHLTDNAVIKDIIILGRSVEYVDNMPVISDDETANKNYCAILDYMGFEQIDNEPDLYHKVNFEKPQLSYC